MRSNRRIVLAAVKQDGHALNIASTELKNDEEIVFAAIEQDSDSLSFAGDTLRNRKDVLEAALGRPFLTKEEMDQAQAETDKYCEKSSRGVARSRELRAARRRATRLIHPFAGSRRGSGSRASRRPLRRRDSPSGPTRSITARGRRGTSPSSRAAAT